MFQWYIHSWNHIEWQGLFKMIFQRNKLVLEAIPNFKRNIRIGGAASLE